MSYGLLLLRIVIGGTMFGHGSQKLFGWFGGNGPRSTAGFFGRNLGFQAPLVMAVAAGLAEAGGGALLAAGLVTPLACLAITVVMLNAILTVHWPNGFWNGSGGIEFPLALATVAVALAATGPGRLSLDRAFGWSGHLSGVWWGVGVLALALAASIVTVTLGRRSRRLTEAHAA